MGTIRTIKCFLPLGHACLLVLYERLLSVDEIEAIGNQGANTDETKSVASVQEFLSR